MYLMRYGYMDGTSTSGKTANLLSPDALKDSIKEFQRLINISILYKVVLHNIISLYVY